METALDEYVVSGLGNNIPFLRAVYRNEKYVASSRKIVTAEQA